MERYLHIESGKLGAIRDLPPEGLVFRPFTLFIGKQGTGKSLVAQLAFFFDNLPYLTKYLKAKEGQRGRVSTPKKTVRSILDGLRSTQRSFAVFADPNVKICWATSEDEERQCFSMYRQNRQINFTEKERLLDVVNQYLKPDVNIPVRGSALFLPAERVLYSHATPAGWDLLSLPLTLRLFGETMEQAVSAMRLWPKGVPDTEPGRWAYDKGRSILGGIAYRWGERWKWRIREGVQIDIDMASAGQKANWPIVMLAQVLPSWRESGEIAWPFTLYIEEPEIHLHPAAQVDMVHLFAYLVRQGFRIVLTTHSLTVLYALNNLLQASRLGDEVQDGVPSPDVRLSAEDVSAYLFQDSGVVEDLIDRRERFISEVPLGLIGDQLGDEMNRIWALIDASGA